MYKWGSVALGTMTPKIRVRRRLRLEAIRLGRNPDASIAASMRVRVTGRTELGLLKYFDTVGRDKPTKCENSSIVRSVVADGFAASGGFWASFKGVSSPAGVQIGLHHAFYCCKRKRACAGRSLAFTHIVVACTKVLADERFGKVRFTQQIE